MYQADFHATPITDVNQTLFAYVINTMFQGNITSIEILRKTNIELFALRFVSSTPLVHTDASILSNALKNAGFFSYNDSYVQYFSGYENNSLAIILWTSLQLAALTVLCIGLACKLV